MLDGNLTIKDTGIGIEKKYMYFPIFEAYQQLKRFRGTTRIIVNNKFDFIGYHDGNIRLIALKPVDKLPGEQEE